ncbi:MAG: MBL fold metallo-hydrolase [Candidatus Aminicenantaceae bacterium]
MGTGGSVATPERDNTSFGLKTNANATLVLIDCTGSVIKKIKQCDLNPLDVRSILITHIHPDHVFGLPSFVHSLMFEDTFVRIYGSEETIDFCRKLLDLFNLLERELKIRLDFIPVKPGEDFELAYSLEIEAFEVPHSSSSLGFHFILRKEGKEIIYSGDTPVNSALFKRAEGKDYLIHDCSTPSRYFIEYPSLSTMHTNSLELGKLAQEAQIKCLVPCHFFGELEFSLSEIEEEIKKNYQGKLIIPKDLEKIIL